MFKKIISIFIFSIMIVALVSFKASALEVKKCEDQKVILIDPGHGGIDGGAKSQNGTIEKDINLAISLKLREALNKKGNYKVHMTREEDIGLYGDAKTIKEKKRADLKKRTTIKRDTKCDIFVSIHQNMFTEKKAYGAQVWYASNDKSKNLAHELQESFKSNINNDNKRVENCSGKAYMILRDNYEGASVLVECGFLSNPKEEKLLTQKEYQNKVVDAIVEGIDNYFNSKAKEPVL